MSTTLSRAEMEAKLLSDATGANDEAPPMQWIRPLVEFLGDSEPLDDDECDWIIRGILPRGEPALIAGAPKCGKTWLALDVAICAATGRGWLGFDNTLGRPAKVLVAAYEDKQSRLAQRIYWLARGHGIDRFEFESTLAITQLPLKLPGSEMLSKLSAELNRWQADVVIIDSLSRVMHGDQNSTQDMTLFTADWLELCRAAEIGRAHV